MQFTYSIPKQYKGKLLYDNDFNINSTKIIPDQKYVVLTDLFAKSILNGTFKFTVNDLHKVNSYHILDIEVPYYDDMTIIICNNTY